MTTPVRSTMLVLTIALASTAAACGETADEAPETAEPAGVSEPPLNPTTFDAVDEARLRELVPADAEVTRVAGDMQFLEGPVWREQEGGHLLFSDVAANELKRWSPETDVETFRSPSGPTNGNTLDLEGRLVSAQHDGRVTRTEDDGTVTTLVDQYMGDQLSSPNDVVVKSDGTIWFTDPTYGLGDREQETPGNYVYRYDPESEELTAVVTDGEQPNGLCFSPDESVLYLADSGQGSRHIRAFEVTEDGGVGAGEPFASIDQGAPDGIRCDERGNVWSSAGDGVRIFSPDGERIGTILVPESPANLEFGGPDGRTLYITARTSLYSVPTLVGDARAR